MTRVFDAPRGAVWQALSRPELLKRWWGLRAGDWHCWRRYAATEQSALALLSPLARSLYVLASGLSGRRKCLN